MPLAAEWDGLDHGCIHFIASTAGMPIATARLLPDGHIGRIAVLREWRGLGIGRHILERVITVARKNGHSELLLNAQLHALPFYEKLGFEAFGGEFQDAGLPHRTMRRRDKQ